MMGQSLVMSLLPLGFGPPLTVASRLLHPYSTKDKTCRLLMKQLSTARNTQRESQSLYREENREEGERGDQEEKKGVKREEQSSQ